MDHRLLYLFSSGLFSSPDSKTRFPFLVFLVFLASLQWQCQNPEEPPAPTTASQKTDAIQPEPVTANAPPTLSLPAAPSSGSSEIEVSNSCCEIIANPELKGRLGRLVVNFPEGANLGSTRIDVFKPGDPKTLKGVYGGHTFDLLPGSYEVEISKKRLTGVLIQSAHDTKVKVGVLHVNAGGSTRIDVIDEDGQTSLTSGYGNQTIGLPVGMFQVMVAGQGEAVTIEEGKVTEF